MITEESFLDFKCPYCEGIISFPQADAGLARACPNCRETVIVPADGSDSGRMLPLPIESPRLRLRRFAAGDWRDLLEFMSDEELFRYTGGGPMEEDDVLRWLESDSHARLTNPDQMFYLGLELKEAGKLVGFIGLRSTDALQAGLHIVVSRAYQRKGFGLEAVQGLLNFCFKDIRLHRVTARSDGLNVAACKLAEKAGLRREGEFIKDTLAQDGWHSSVFFAKLEEEFSKRA